MANTNFQESMPAAYATKIINQTNRHVFLTGKAGTGKTTFLRNIILNTHKKTIVVAPTGIAAINAGGVTIHSQFQLPFGPFVPARQFQINNITTFKVNNADSLLRTFQMGRDKRQVLNAVELLIIDEVSMLRADLLDAINTVLQSVRKNAMPFGGVQVLFIGDLFQLPPVVKNDEWQLLSNFYKSIYFFDAHVLHEDKPVYIELDKIYRQIDPTFINMLNNFRNNEVELDDMERLNSHYKPNFIPENEEKYITLTTHNAKADTINKTALDNLFVKSHYFPAKVTGEFSANIYPVDSYMELKVGTQIMFIKNDPSGEKKFFNGKLAVIDSIDDDGIKVKFGESESILTLERYEWKNIKYELNPAKNEIEEKEIGSFTQFPIKLAWAITVHKSQGLTFERAILDINAAFAPGQVYVALSRLKSLDGLVLTAPAVRLNTSQDESILNYSHSHRKQGDLDLLIAEESHTFARNYLLKCYNFFDLFQQVCQHLESYDKPEHLSEKQKHLPWALALKEDFEPVKRFADSFNRQVNGIFVSKEEDYFLVLHQRIEAATAYFSPLLQGFSKRIMDHQILMRKEKNIKNYLSELAELESFFYRQFEFVSKALILTKAIANNTILDKESLDQAFDKKARTQVLEALENYN